jgi:hypothetical protein
MLVLLMFNKLELTQGGSAEVGSIKHGNQRTESSGPGALLTVPSYGEDETLNLGRVACGYSRGRRALLVEALIDAAGPFGPEGEE